LKSLCYDARSEKHQIIKVIKLLSWRDNSASCLDCWATGRRQHY